MTDSVGEASAMTERLGSMHALRSVPSNGFPIEPADDACAQTIREIVAESRTDGTTHPAKLVVVSDPNSPIVDALERLGTEVTSVTSPTASAIESAPTQDAVVVIAGQSACTVDRGDIVRDAYRLVRPGGRLVLVVDDVAIPRSRRAQQSRSLRDEVATLLFDAGFVAPRFHAAAGERVIVDAMRGPKVPPAERPLTLSVVMPVFNERATFAEVMDQLVKKRIDGIDIEIVVVESNSSDGTRDEVLRFNDTPNVRLVLEDRPQGKGHAVRAGLAEATGDFVLIQDADLEYDMDDYEMLLAPLRKLETSFVLGSRTRTDGARFGVRHFEKQVVIGRLMNVGNAVFLGLFNLVYGERLQDPFTMYKVFRRDCLHRMVLECNRFDFDWELMAKLLRAGYRPIEIPVSYHSRSFDEGKKISVFGDPLSWIVACFRYRFTAFER